jgi:hypothetical protein
LGSIEFPCRTVDRRIARPGVLSPAERRKMYDPARPSPLVASAFPDSIVSATWQKGVSGVVTINGITPLNGALVVLSSELRKAVALSASSCAARANLPQSSLVEAGRGGLPQDPDASVPALYIAGCDVRLDPRPVAPHAAAGGECPPALRVVRCG